MFLTRFQKMLMCNVYFWNQSVFIESAGNGIIIKSFNHQFNAIYIYNGWINSVQKDYFQNSTQSSYEYIHIGRLTCSLWGCRALLTSSDERWQCTLKRTQSFISNAVKLSTFNFLLNSSRVQSGGTWCMSDQISAGTSVQHRDTDRGDKYNQGQSFSSSRQNYQRERGAIGWSTVHTMKYWCVENSISILFVTKVSVLCA